MENQAVYCSPASIAIRVCQNVGTHTFHDLDWWSIMGYFRDRNLLICSYPTLPYPTLPRSETLGNSY